MVNAAGGNVAAAVIGPDQDIFRYNIEALKKVFDLNLYGTILPTTIFGRHMADNGGTIINISSMAAQTAITRVLGYSMAKAAIDNFTRWMAVELANRYGDKIRMNAIAPGFFVTHQNRQFITTPDGGYTARGEAVIRNTPYKRFGEPEELIGTLICLLSDASKFVSGEVICVDGGFRYIFGRINLIVKSYENEMRQTWRWFGPRDPVTPAGYKTNRRRRHCNRIAPYSARRSLARSRNKKAASRISGVWFHLGCSRKCYHSRIYQNPHRQLPALH